MICYRWLWKSEYAKECVNRAVGASALILKTGYTQEYIIPFFGNYPIAS